MLLINSVWGSISTKRPELENWISSNLQGKILSNIQAQVSSYVLVLGILCLVICPLSFFRIIELWSCYSYLVQQVSCRWIITVLNRVLRKHVSLIGSECPEWVVNAALAKFQILAVPQGSLLYRREVLIVWVTGFIMVSFKPANTLLAHANILK